jgi:hypothetical protein
MAVSTMATATDTPVLSWTPVEMPGEGARLLDAGDTFIAIDRSGRHYQSDDGLAWIELDVPGAIIDSYQGALLLQEGDGPTVTLRDVDGTVSSADLPGVSSTHIVPGNSVNSESAFGPAGAVLAACDAQCLTSTVWHTPDGEAWEVVSRVPGELWEVLTATSDGFVARTDLGGDFKVLYSTDGVHWARINHWGYDRYDVIGTTPWGTILRMSIFDGPEYRTSDGSLVQATADGLADLAPPTDIASLFADHGRWSLGAGGLGLVGIDIPGRRVLFSPDGVDWTLEPLPDSVPRLLMGRMGGGRPGVHVGRDAFLMSTYVCEAPDGSEVDCEETEDDVPRQVWWRATLG